MNSKELLTKIGSLSAAAAALLTASQVEAPTAEARLINSPERISDAPAATPPKRKLLLTPATKVVSGPSTIFASHASHSSHSSHVSGSSYPDSSDTSSGSSNSTSPDTSGSTDTSGSGTPLPTGVNPLASNDTQAYVSADLTVSEQILASPDLAGKSDKQVAELLVGTFAAYGYSFTSVNHNYDAIQAYLKPHPWYKPNTDSTDVAYSRMSSQAQSNVQLLYSVLRQRKSTIDELDEGQVAAGTTSDTSTIPINLGEYFGPSISYSTTSPTTFKLKNGTTITGVIDHYDSNAGLYFVKVSTGMTAVKQSDIDTMSGPDSSNSASPNS